MLAGVYFRIMGKYCGLEMYNNISHYLTGRLLMVWIWICYAEWQQTGP